MTDISKNTNETKEDHSVILSIFLNGILYLKTNDLLNYCVQLIEMIIYIRDKKDKYNYIDIDNENNKEFLKTIYQIYSNIFTEYSFIYSLIKNDMNNGMKIFKKLHLVYILFILSGFFYIHNKLKTKYSQFYNFLKQFFKTEKCQDLKCPICSKMENFDKPITFRKKTSTIKIINNKFKKVDNINNKIINYPNIKNNFISISNDKALYQKCINNISIGNNHYSYNLSESSNDKSIIYKNKSKDNLSRLTKKKYFYSQIMGANEKDKKNFFQQSPIKSKYKRIQIKTLFKNKEIKNAINKVQTIEEKKYNTDKKEDKDKNLNKMSKKVIHELKIDLNKKMKKQVEKEPKKIKHFNKNLELTENNIFNDNNNKTKEYNKINKNMLIKFNKIKIKIPTDSKINNDKKIYINTIDSEKKKNINKIIEKKEYKKVNSDLNESSKIIKENINLMEKDIKAFKEQNIYIKQQLEKMLNKYIK